VARLRDTVPDRQGALSPMTTRMQITPLDAASRARVDALRDSAIFTVSESLRDECDAEFGAASRDACREDLGFELEFLDTALEFGTVQPLVDYLRWFASVLVARGSPAAHATRQLEQLIEFFASRLDPADAGVVCGILQAARDRFVELGPVADTPGRDSPEAWPESAEFEVALLAGNHRGASSIFQGALDRGRTLVEVGMHVVQPALYRIGQKWQANLVTVAQEHLSTAIAQMTMNRGLLTVDPPPWNGRKVLLACVQGNEHSVGLQMVADAFQLDGWDVQYLGANVPSTALVDQVEQWRPDLLCLSLSFARQMRAAKEAVRAIERRLGNGRPAVMVGGLAINRLEDLATLIGADAWSANAADAVTVGTRLAGPRPPA